MPARNSRFRALNDDFRQFLDARDAWPSFKAILWRLKGQGGGRRADIVGLRAGAAVPQKYVRAIAELVAPAGVLRDYLGDPGAAGPGGGPSIEAICDRIAGPLLPARPGVPEGEDSHLQGVDALLGLFLDYVWGAIVTPQTLGKNEKDVALGVRLMMASVGRQLAGDRQLGDEGAIRRAEAHMAIAFDDYRDRAVALWRRAPWSLCFGVTDRQRVGASLVLPLSEAAYDALLAGERTSHSLGPDDLAVPSRHLFLENVGHRAPTSYPWFGKATAQTKRAIHVQLAALTLGADPRASPPFRFLSLGATPLNIRRLKAAGFRPTGRFMKDFDAVEFLELDPKKGWPLFAVVRQLQERLIERPEWRSPSVSEDGPAERRPPA